MYQHSIKKFPSIVTTNEWGAKPSGSQAKKELKEK
jgi:hypothetical protein